MKKVAIILGGMSTEHEVSIQSGISILKNIDIKKYDAKVIYIDKDGTWYDYNTSRSEKKEEIKNISKYLKKFDVIFPALHGAYGEDGTIQGMLELLNIPYVGCGVLASSLAMDKVYSKIVFQKAGFFQAKYVYLKKNENGYIFINNDLEEERISNEDMLKKIVQTLKFPLFIKPSNSGSSIGITKANSIRELENAINLASKYDTKILIEEGIKARELECAVLESDSIIVSSVGEVINNGEFYDYDLKYKSKEIMTKIPADISEKISNQIKELAVKAFKVIDGKGLARIDFFLDENDKIYINEINTMPGFTATSMYPKLFENVGITYKEIITNLIENSMKP